MNQANPSITRFTAHLNAGLFTAAWGEWRVTGEYEVEFDFVQFDPSALSDILNLSGRSFTVFSKAAFDTNGEGWAEDKIVATGPFEAEEWRSDRITVVSRYSAGGSHHVEGMTPRTDRIEFIEITEPFTRLVSLENGTVDAAILEPLEASRAREGGFQSGGVVKEVQLGIFFGGNLWEHTYAATGEELPVKAPFVHDQAWIGNPDGKHDGGQPSDDMEQARLVRRALALSINRDRINQEVLGGAGSPVHVAYFSTSHPNWDARWEYPYSPVQAKDILENQIVSDYRQTGHVSEEALNGNSFDIQISALPEFGTESGVMHRVTAELASDWGNLGIFVRTGVFSYDMIRDSLVRRNQGTPLLTSCGIGTESLPWSSPKGVMQTTLTRGGASCMIESPEILDFYRRMATAENDESARQAADEYLDYVYHWVLQPGVVSVPIEIYYHPDKIKTWSPRPMISGLFGDVWNLELR